MPQTFHCPSCTAPLEHPGHATTMRCGYCGNTVIVPESLRQAAAPAAPPPGTAAAQMVELAQLLAAGRKIDAIRLYRELTGAGLQEAKEAVERLEAGEPVVLSDGASHEMLQIDGLDENAAPTTPKRGRSFFGSWGCLMFAFFWIVFLFVMVGTLIVPNAITVVTPWACPAGTVDSYGERVGFYQTDGFEGTNITLLQCVDAAGTVTTAHPVRADGLLCGGMLALGGVLIFGLLLFLRLLRAMIAGARGLADDGVVYR